MKKQPSSQKDADPLDKLKGALKWLDGRPFDQKMVLAKIVAGSPSKTERKRIYENIAGQSGKETAQHIRTIAEWCLEITNTEEIERVGKMADITPKTINVLKVAHEEKDSTAHAIDIRALSEVPLDVFPKAIETILVDSYIENKCRPTEALKQANLSIPKEENISRAMFNCCYWIGSRPINEINGFLVDNGLDEKRAGIIAEVISKHHSDLKIWNVALKQEEILSKLEDFAGLREFMKEYKEAFDTYSEKLEKVLSSLESLLRSLRM